MSKTVESWAAELGKHPRTVRRWLTEGRIAGAVVVNNQWIVPDDATTPRDGRVIAGERRRQERSELAELARAHGATMYQSPGSPVTGASAARYASGPLSGDRFWYTVDDLAFMFAPHLSRHAIVAMLRDGELRGYRRGRNGSWIVPRSELVRISGRQ